MKSIKLINLTEKEGGKKCIISYLVNELSHKKLLQMTKQIQGKAQNNVPEKLKEQKGEQSSKRFWGSRVGRMEQQ